MTSSLPDAIDRVVVEHERVGSPIARYLRAGPDPATVKRRLGDLGLTPSPQLVEWFGRLGNLDQAGYRADRGGTSGALGLYPKGFPLDLGSAVENCQLHRDSARTLEEWTSGAIKAREYWRSSWFPIMSSEPVWIAVDLEQSVSPVWQVNWEPGDDDETVLICEDVASFVDAAVAAFRRGDYAWDARYGELIMADPDRTPEPPTCSC